MPRLVILFFALNLAFAAISRSLAEDVSATADESPDIRRITFRDKDDTSRTILGEVMQEAQDGGVMMKCDDGRIWIIQPDQITDREKIADEYSPISPDEAAQRMLSELGDRFSVYQTPHYVILYDGSEVYAKQVGSLFEQLYKNFFTFWKNQRWQLPEPDHPLVAIVLKDHDSFLNHATAEIGPTAKSMIGYYNLASNQMTTFNVPNWERNVSTIIHEATHQLAYNCGLQQRYADNPMWVSEGLATFFESPDMRNPGRWRAIGRVNQVNLARWKSGIRNRPDDSLATLLASDQRYKDAETATFAYAEGWALTYFLIKTSRKEYVAYLQSLSQGKPLAERSARERVEMFEAAFGPLDKVDKSFLTYMRRVK
ncbi:hypothetical protein Pla22_30930 [Rubripirellula amarantea]|uniref:DUF1570 domain-containing protein n=1 Tax=Rubripirellula amarantea TaxID=2527999 RepID=A0A5C5WK15_9BACT|nr:DUF1570 domain-containing protein [Rubripirellula amarantea]TWT50351.1 hypothetical protein Pla22_30930 [Rubripirellula amarantea]